MNKVIVGLTGGFGTGKSTVGHMFEELGAKVVDSDQLAHEAYLKGSPVEREIARLFREKGPGPFLDSKAKRGQAPFPQVFDRKKIAGVVFRDAKLRKKLESIIHPYVFQRIVEEIADAGERVIVLEIPLLFETGFHTYCHHTVMVECDPEAAEKRLRGKGFAAAEVKARREAQMPAEEKIKRAQFVISNSGTLDQTRREVQKVWKKILTASKGES